MEAGLSWITILRKRESYRSAFDDFEPSKIAGYGERKLAELLDNPGIIRNRLKIEAAVVNAKAFIEVQRHFGSFDTYIWQFVNHTPVQKMQGRAWATFVSPMLRASLADAVGWFRGALRVRDRGNVPQGRPGDGGAVPPRRLVSALEAPIAVAGSLRRLPTRPKQPGAVKLVVAPFDAPAY